MHHSKYQYIKTLVDANVSPVLLVGPAGTGKSTLIMQIAEERGTGFASQSCTKQMSVSALLGFISINGQYIPTQFREAYEKGYTFLLDEIDAADPNVLLALNTIENGFVSFPDGIVKGHPDFRLCATANPFNDHAQYTGRSKLDFSTIDRFFVVELPRDNTLEISLTSEALHLEAESARSIMSSLGMSRTVTVRDCIRMHKLSQLGIVDCVFKEVVFNDDETTYTMFKEAQDLLKEAQQKASRTQADATTIDELWEIIQQESQS